MTMSTSVKCDHCGTPCSDDITLDDKVFCCQGCKSVYSLLWANGMESFYQYADSNGKPVEQESEYSFLDNEEIQERVMDFSDGNVGVVRLFLPAIHCSACLWLLERLHKLHSGVIDVRVEFSKRTAHIRFKEAEISLKELAELLQRVGYPPKIMLADGEDEKAPAKDKRLIYQFGVAAFAFGNIMLMALPEYFHPNDPAFMEYSTFFRWLSLVLALPVLFYSAQDYFVNAFKSLRLKKVNIDQPIAIGVLALFLQSLYEISSDTGSGYLDSLAGLMFFLLLGRIFQRKTYESLSFDRDYKSYFPLGITVIEKDGTHKIVPVQNLEKGQRLYVRNGEIIPVDAVIMNGDPVIDNAFVTGESTPVRKQIGDKVYAGGKQCGGAIEVEVINSMDQSYLTQLWNNQSFSGNKADRFQSLTDKVSGYFVAVVLSIAVLAFGFWWYVDSWVQAVHVFTAVLIVACPCALALAAPFATGHALRLMGRKGLYLKSAHVVESLADVNHVVWDKTGTLTNVRNGRVEWGGAVLSMDDKSAISGLMSSSQHPLSTRISSELGVMPAKVDSFEEVVGSGVTGRVNGSTWRIGSAQWIGVSIEDVSNRSVVAVEKDGQELGCFTLDHIWREGVDDVVSSVGTYATQMVLTGDGTGEKVALEKLFGPEVSLRFKQKPADKLEAIHELQKQGYHVAMIGDGLNDSGALQQAEVGISIAEDINNFTPASDGILEAQALYKLPEFIRLAKSTKRVIYMSFALSFAYNIGGLAFAISGMLSPVFSAVLMPLSSISVVVFVTLMVQRFKFRASKDSQREVIPEVGRG